MDDLRKGFRADKDSILARTASRSIPIAVSASWSRPPNRTTAGPARRAISSSTSSIVAPQECRTARAGRGPGSWVKSGDEDDREMLAAEVMTDVSACVPAGRGRARSGCPGSGAWALPAPNPLAVLAVHGLLGNAEPPRDVLPGPPELPRVLDLDDFQPLGERAQGRHGAEPDIRIGAGGAPGDFELRGSIRVSIC